MGIPIMYFATLVAVTISFFLLYKVATLTKLCQDKDKEIEYQTQVKEGWIQNWEECINEIARKDQLIKDLEANVLSLREIKERREHE